MSFFKKNWTQLLLALLCIAIAIEFFRDIFGTGDFVGYINAGNNVLNGNHIYSDYLNTWPPFFSIFSVPLALLDNLNGQLSRGIWLIGMLIAMFYIVKMTVALVLDKQLLIPFFKPSNENQIPFSSPVILIPFLLIFRYLLDNMANIQINIFMLAMTLGTFYLHLNGKDKSASFWLALSISLKVFTIFLLPFFIVKKRWKLVLYSIFWLIFINTIPFFVFGIETSSNYFQQFYTDRAAPFAMILHKNQSFFAFTRSILMNESRGFDIYINLFNMRMAEAKIVSYAVVAIAGSIVLYFFNATDKGEKQTFISQTFFIISCLPLVSPLAWKAYFIFLWPSLFWTSKQLWYSLNQNQFSPIKRWILNLLMSLYILGTIISTEGIIGNYYSDISEIYASITLGSISLLIVHLICYHSTHLNAKGLEIT